MIVGIVLYNFKLFYLKNHDNCIQFPQNYGECPPDYDQYFISQKLKYRVKTPSRQNIALIASFKRQVSFRFDYNSKFFYILKHLKFKLTKENQASVKFYSDVLSQLDSALVPNSIQKYRRGVQAAPNNHRS